ncbi:MAG: hypothetical protein JW940_27715 [Polyangiaceae bacterium]|nr:hypothetical protein [Polyangiaceae bacterium]
MRLVALLAVWASVHPARADVASPSDACVVSDQQRAGEQCIACRPSTPYCDSVAQYPPEGYTQRCADEELGLEVWCRPTDSSDAGSAGAGGNGDRQAPEDAMRSDDADEGGGCTVAAGEPTCSSWHAILAAIGLIALGCLRRPRH